MATFQLSRSTFSTAFRIRRPPRPLSRGISGKGAAALHIRCRLQESGGDSNGDEPPESLFMKELKRRGMKPTSLLEEVDRGSLESSSGEDAEGNRGRTKRNGVAAAELEKGLLNQRERSMSLNSEGLEGLIPRAKLLLTLGGTFFLGFWPLILITVGLFAALYIYFGPSFVHDGSDIPVSMPPYIDPYTLLEDERLSEVVPRVN